MEVAERLSSSRESERPAAGSAPEPTRPALTALDGKIRPVTLARDLHLVIPGPLGDAVPGGVLQRGGVVAVDGASGAGAVTIALTLVSSATRVGEWAAWVGDPWLGVGAASALGVDLDRFALVRVPRSGWVTATGALMDGMSLVVLAAPGRIHRADARRLAARARERRTVLTVLGAWPERAALRLTAAGQGWRIERGRLVAGPACVEVEHRGAPRRGHVLAEAG